MRRRYKSILVEVAIRRDAVGEDMRGGYTLFERKRTIRLASAPLGMPRTAPLRTWALTSWRPEMDNDLFRATRRHDIAKATKGFSFRGWVAHMLAMAFSALVFCCRIRPGNDV